MKYSEVRLLTTPGSSFLKTYSLAGSASGKTRIQNCDAPARLFDFKHCANVFLRSWAVAVETAGEPVPDEEPARAAAPALPADFVECYSFAADLADGPDHWSPSPAAAVQSSAAALEAQLCYRASARHC